MKQLRKWSRILHRDIGFFFIGASLIYGLSGIALNHMHDWDPNYSIELKNFTTEINLSKNKQIQIQVEQLVNEIDKKENLRKFYYPQENTIKIFLKGGSSIIVNTETGKGQAEFLKKRPLFYQVNFLHYNPNFWWTWFSDVFAGALILFSITSFFMIKGKKGIIGRGGIYAALGITIPILLLFLS